MKELLRKYILICLIIVSITQFGCVTIYNPATQKNETLLIDTQQEVAMGCDMDKEIQQKMKILADTTLQQRLNSIGNRIAMASDRQDLRYNFKTVNDKQLNAFAIPGGYVYVNSGLMDIATDDELACVLAHEVGHIAAKHSVKKLQSVLGYQLVLNIALGISGKRATADAMDIVFNLVSLGYGRQDELLADRLSVRYSKRAHFNPYGMITFLEKLQKDANSKGTHYNPVFLSSHPDLEDRIKNVKNEITLNK